MSLRSNILFVFAGTGLGLSICRKLAESVGGSVGYRPRSDNKRGSLFYVSFPVQV